MNVYRHRKIFSDNMLNHVNQKISYNSLNGLLQYWDKTRWAQKWFCTNFHIKLQIGWRYRFKRTFFSQIMICVSHQKLPKAIESLAVILLTISVVTIGASIYLFESILEKMLSVVVCFINIFCNISLIFGLKDNNRIFILLWMLSAACNVFGGVIILGFALYNELNFTSSLEEIVPTSIAKNVYLTCYVGLYIWSGVQVFHLYKELDTNNLQ